MVANPGRTPDTRRIRRLKSPHSIEVDTDASGTPVAVCLNSRWRNVTLARRPWRIDQHWWRGDPIRRVYYRVTPVDWPPLTIYCDLQSGEWSRQEY